MLKAFYFAAEFFDTRALITPRPLALYVGSFLGNVSEASAVIVSAAYNGSLVDLGFRIIMICDK